MKKAKLIRMSTAPNSIGRIALGLGVATLSRLVLNTARRFPYTFALVLSRSLAVPFTAITSLIAVNQATSILGMVFGPIADRFGYRTMMLAGMALLISGMFAAGALPFYAVILMALFLAGLGKSIFDPALQAYVGERVPYERRGMAIGLLEFSWAGSTLAGIPVIGLLIDRFGWRSPFLVLGGVGLLTMLALVILIPNEKGPSIIGETPGGILKSWHRVGKERAALGVLGFAFLVNAANDNLFVVYGAWLEGAFSLSIVALGVGTIVIGLAELLGESLTATLADRIGLKQSVAMGLIFCILSYVILPFLEHSLTFALTGLFWVFLTFEFSIVSCLSLCTELLPGSRATMMASLIAAAGLGRVVGAVLGGFIWERGDIFVVGTVSAGLCALALCVLVWGLRGWRAQ